MLVTGQVRTESIPHEPGQTMTFRRLSWREWEQAADAARDRALAMCRDLTPEMLSLMRERSAQGEAPAEQFDAATVLHAGIAGWSYDAPVTPENIDALDAQTAEWALAQLLGARESDRKNSPASSTAP